MKKIQGVGINDADYPVTKTERVKLENGKVVSKQVWMCPYYAAWKNMIFRCYSTKKYTDSSYSSYIESVSSESWHRFSNFLSWAKVIGIENHHLDKDILIMNNKVYSEETCSLVPPRVNMLLLDNKGNRNPELLLGVYDIRNTHDYPLKKGFRARVGIGQGYKSLGNFYTKEDAHFAWQKGKAEYILETVDWWKTDSYFKRSFNTLAGDALLFRYELLKSCYEAKIIIDRLP